MLSERKRDYKTALRHLEEISDSIHRNRSARHVEGREVAYSPLEGHRYTKEIDKYCTVEPGKRMDYNNEGKDNNITCKLEGEELSKSDQQVANDINEFDLERFKDIKDLNDVKEKDDCILKDFNNLREKETTTFAEKGKQDNDESGINQMGKVSTSSSNVGIDVKPNLRSSEKKEHSKIGNEQSVKCNIRSVSESDTENENNNNQFIEIRGRGSTIDFTPSYTINLTAIKQISPADSRKKEASVKIDEMTNDNLMNCTSTITDSQQSNADINLLTDKCLIPPPCEYNNNENKPCLTKTIIFSEDLRNISDVDNRRVDSIDLTSLLVINTNKVCDNS